MRRDGFTSVSSDHIDGAKFDSLARQLTLKFKNGNHYVVHGVTTDDYQAFMDAPSQGSHFHSVIKPNFEIERVK